VDSKWFTRPIPRTNAQLRLFCLPYAGGSAAIYTPWSQQLDPSVELIAVQPPGRGNRIFEVPYTSMEDFVADLAKFIRPLLNVPYALFGHSLGSRVAIELARKLSRDGAPEPMFFFASGSRAPHIMHDRPTTHLLPDDEFIQELRNLNGTPEAILNNKELMDLHLPMLRADFQIAETFQAKLDQKLSSYPWIFAGEDDEYQTEEDLLSWCEYFHKKAHLQMFTGGHFFIETGQSAVIQKVNHILTKNIYTIT